jgi:DMSO/TMAO reductase YedYZ molybdopterin-dependent catalytic subunit
MSEEEQIRIDHVRELIREKGDSPWPDGDGNTANVIGERRYLTEPLEEDEARKQMSRRTRRGFLFGGGAAILGLLGWRWLSDETKTGLYKRAFEFNENVSRLFYSPRRLVPEFPLSEVTKPERANGAEGLGPEFDLSSWTLHVSGLAGRSDDLVLSLDDIKRLPRTEMTTEFKCIEGWSTIVHWAGVRFSEFASAYLPRDRNGGKGDVVNRPQDLPRYVALSTPDEKYFVGWDIESMLHPQTLLAYEMNGEPLRPEHGAPLRLASPTKYGIKQIKRIGRIDFTDERPRDFWAQPAYGYDWYSGL